MNIITPKLSERKNMTICVPFNQKEYIEIVDQAKKFRLYIDSMIENFPELFSFRDI